MLGLDSSIDDEATIAAARRALQYQLQDLSKKDPTKQQIANSLLNVMSRARSTLRDADKRAAYLGDLRLEFRNEVVTFLEGRRIHAAADFDEDCRRHLVQTVGPLYGLCATHSDEVIQAFDCLT